MLAVSRQTGFCQASGTHGDPCMTIQTMTRPNVVAGNRIMPKVTGGGAPENTRLKDHRLTSTATIIARSV
jgi:hypothetical protein